MAVKYRTSAIFTGGVKSGSDGNTVSSLYGGTTSACFYSTGAGASNSGSFAATGVKQGDIIFLATACTTGSAIITSGSVVSDNTVSFKTYNIGGGTAAASTITLQWLALRVS